MASEWRKCEWGDIATLEYGNLFGATRRQTGAIEFMAQMAPSDGMISRYALTPESLSVARAHIAESIIPLSPFLS